MADEQHTPPQTPAWALVVIAALFTVTGFGYGMQVGRDAAVARPESAAGLDRYTQPLIYGPLAGLAVLCVWLGSRRRPEPEAAGH